MLSSKPRRRVFGVLALAAGILLLVLEWGSYRQAGQVSWFWLAVGILAAALGLFDIMARRSSDIDAE